MKSLQKIRVFLFPSSNKNNKYIELFVNSIKNYNDEVDVVSVRKDFLLNVLLKLPPFKFGRYKNIIHIHWPTVFYGSRFWLKSIFLLCVNTILLFILKNIFGFKIVMTTHNFFAHDYPNPKIDKVGTWLVQALADVFIVQQQVTLREYKEKFPDKSVFFIPHGNYIGAYGPKKEAANDLKRSLGFANGDRIILSFGAIAPYKVNEKIISAVANLKNEPNSYKLLIVGKGDVKYVKRLREFSKGLGVDSKIENKFINDADVPKYFSIADYSIFYYDQSEMTSGGIILSLSYGIPVITRNIPASEIVTGSNGFVFNNDEELLDILRKINQSSPVFNQRDIINSVTGNEWYFVANELISVYRKI